MGTTTSGIVYPDASSVPSRSALVTLATTTDAILTGTGWVTMTNEGTAGTARYRVVTGIVFVEFSLTISLPTGVTTPLVTSANGLPSAYSPTLGFAMDIGYIPATTTGIPGAIIANTDGSISCVNKSGTAGASVSARYSYPVG